MATKDKAAKRSYDSDNIKNLQFPESIRQKPTLYIGPIDERGIVTILREVADNVVDEALAGRASTCDIFLHKPEDGNMKGFFVLDNGEGIPVKPMKIRNPINNEMYSVPAIKAILSMTHTSGKFDDSSYAASRGTHGLGVKASNALSRVYKVWTFRDDAWWHIEFRKGTIKGDLVKLKAGPKHPGTGNTLKKGTLVYLEPDPEVFTVMQDDTLESLFGIQRESTKSLLEWCRLASFFTEGMKLRVHHYNGASKEFYSENGPEDFINLRIARLNKAIEKEEEKVKLIQEGAQFTYRDNLVECVAAFTNADGSNLDAFSNGLRNVEGGVHVDAFMAALKASLQEYAPKKSTFTVRELRDGLVALVNVKLSAPQFDSQTKEKLVDERAGAPVEEFLTKALKDFFKKNKKLAIAICERANNLHSLKMRFTASKKVLNSLRSIARKGFPSKASIAPNCKPHERELFLIEGDSAAGSAKSARDSHFQETLPLKGKVTNALRDPKGKAIESVEVINVLAQIGFDPKAEDPYSKLRVGKIICLADPDPDGPLVGSTLVHVRYDKVWHVVSLETLASEEWKTRTYQVLSWNGNSLALADAMDCRITNYVNRLVKIKFANGTKLEVDENHKFPIFTEKLDYRVDGNYAGLKYVAAGKLKTGDRIVSVDATGMKCEPHNALGKNNLEFVSIEKIKDHACDPTPVYCLTVPQHHNFVLAGGLLSKNCHINSLLLSLFYKFLPELFNRGMIYVAEIPEFYAIDKHGKFYSAGKPEKLAGILEKAGVKADICHIKGYGEVSWEILRILAFDPATRSLSRITPMQTESGELEFVKVMSSDSEARKKLLGIPE